MRLFVRACDHVSTHTHTPISLRTYSDVCVRLHSFALKSHVRRHRTCRASAALTQHNEVDLVPVVLPSGLDFTGVLPRVGQLQVTDEQGGVSAQVVSR